jgi:putative hydrolase of the HAD superfamily
VLPGTARRSLILLDALGTLVRLRPPGPALQAELLGRFGVDVDQAAAERALAAEIAYYRAHLQDGADRAALERLRARCAEVLRVALPDSERLAAVPGPEMTEALLAALRFEPYPDAAPALAAARARGQRLIVVSNWDVSLPEVLERTGLATWLDDVVTSAGVGARKPDPRIFHRALALAGAEPAEALHVGDSPVEDLEGARAAGIAAVLIRRDGEPAPPGVAAIASLSELGRASADA